MASLALPSGRLDCRYMPRKKVAERAHLTRRGLLHSESQGICETKRSIPIWRLPLFDSCNPDPVTRTRTVSRTVLEACTYPKTLNASRNLNPKPTVLTSKRQHLRLWKVEIFSPAPVPLQLGRLRSLTPGRTAWLPGVWGSRAGQGGPSPPRRVFPCVP